MLLPDFAVGSYESDEAVVLYTRPVVYLSTTMTFYPKQVNIRYIRFTNKLSRSTFYAKSTISYTRVLLKIMVYLPVNILPASLKPIYQRHMP